MAEVGGIERYKRVVGSNKRVRSGQGLQRKVGRRAIIKAGAIGVGVAGLMRGGLAFKEDTERGVGAIKERASGLFTGSKNQPEVAENPAIETAAQKPLTEFDLVYANLSQKERQDALLEIFRAQEVMLPNILPNLARIKSYEPLIRESAQVADVPENLLLGLMIAESLGDAKAVSPAGAKGLTQMMAEMANKYHLRISQNEDDERFAPGKILPSTAKELKEAYDLRYGDWGLAFWEWHAGAVQVFEALRVYFREKYNEELEDINVSPQDDSQEAQDVAGAEAVRRLASNKAKIQGRVNLAELFQNQTVAGMFQGEEWDKTAEYVPRIVAASIVYNANKSLI